MSLVVNKLQSYERGCVQLVGSFATNGVSHPSATSNKGGFFTVLRTSQGLWTVTLDTIYKALESINVTVGLASGSLAVRLPVVGTKTTSTFQIRTLDATGTAQDIAANADNIISFTVNAKWSTV